MSLALQEFKNKVQVPHVSTLTSIKMSFSIFLYVSAYVSSGICGEGKFPSDVQALVHMHCILLAPQRNQSCILLTTRETF